MADRKNGQMGSKSLLLSEKLVPLIAVALVDATRDTSLLQPNKHCIVVVVNGKWYTAYSMKLSSTKSLASITLNKLPEVSSIEFGSVSNRNNNNNNLMLRRYILSPSDGGNCAII